MQLQSSDSNLFSFTIFPFNLDAGETAMESYCSIWQAGHSAFMLTLGGSCCCSLGRNCTVSCHKRLEFHLRNNLSPTDVKHCQACWTTKGFLYLLKENYVLCHLNQTLGSLDVVITVTSCKGINYPLCCNVFTHSVQIFFRFLEVVERMLTGNREKVAR